jgi:2-dehydropantoate 2-reductase
MRYVIIGAGAVGGTIGARLHQAGHDVTLVARGDHLQTIRARGLTLTTPDGEHTARVPAVADPGELILEADSVLVLAVKSQDTHAAIWGWVDAPVRGGGTAGERLPLLTAQNGVANERAALRLFARVYPVCVWLPATFLEPAASRRPVTRTPGCCTWAAIRPDRTKRCAPSRRTWRGAGSWLRSATT